MNKKNTLDDVIVRILESAVHALRVEEIYQQIIEDGLYNFKSSTPIHIVRTALRRSSDNLKFKSSKTKKLYSFLEDGSYILKKNKSISLKPIDKVINEEEIRIIELKNVHKKYIESFKRNILTQLQSFDPTEFEIFCGNLLKAFGFKNIKVTSKTKDGGFDGHGKLKIGLAWMPVAFECKRYKNNTIGRPKIDQFRGSIQGQFPQGIFFTTSRFTKEAQLASFKPGADPIILIDGNGIVDLMVEKEFGVEKEQLAIYTSAIDLAMQKQ